MRGICRPFNIIVLLFILITANGVAETKVSGAGSGLEKVKGAGGNVPVPEPTAEALRFHRTGNYWWCLRTAWGVVVPAAFVWCGWSARMAGRARRFSAKWQVQLGLFFVGWILVNFLIDLPLNFIGGFLRLRHYGLDHQSMGKWTGDQLKQLVFQAGIGVPVVILVYYYIRRTRSRWWIWTAASVFPMIVAATFLKPIVFDPLFNEFGPMKDQKLEGKILSLAEKTGVQGSRVFQVKKSEETRTLNAYVTGFWGTKRIVLWDTMVAHLDEDELIFVMAHELGHYVLGHVWKGTVCAMILVALGLYAVHRAAPFVLERFPKRSGVNSITDFAVIPLLIALLNLAAAILEPTGYAFSRKMEHQADKFAIELTGLNHAAATGFVKSTRQNLAVPRPSLFYRIFRSTHPSVGDRIDFLNSYHPLTTTNVLSGSRSAF